MKNSILNLLASLLLLGPSIAFAGSATWNQNPISGDWNTAANWTPATVPNSETDTAAFRSSNLTAVSTSVTTAVDSVIFSAAASPYTLTVGGGEVTFTLWGGGVINNSAYEQTIVLPTIGEFGNARITFRNSATAGDQVTYVGMGAYVSFLDYASAGGATFTISNESFSQGNIFFAGNSTAGNANITLNDGSYADFFMEGTAGNAVITNNPEGFTEFVGARAGNATIINNGATNPDGSAGSTVLFAPADAGTATFINRAAVVKRGRGGFTQCLGAAMANATLINEGSSFGGASSGLTVVNGNTDLGAATLIAHGGMHGGSGGVIQFWSWSQGGTARLELDGNASIDISVHELPRVIVGSVEGEGEVFLGANNLTIGSSNLSTELAAIVQDGGKHNRTGGTLTKIGTGTLTLSGANTYTGVTTVSSGALRVNNAEGSGTGTGEVHLDAGTLGGAGTIGGGVTVGTGSGSGAFLAPGVGASQPTTLTIKSALDFKADGTYTYKLNTKKAKADQLVADGVTIESGAQFNFSAVANKKLNAGQVFTALSNTSATPISGTFANLADGSTFTAGRNNFQVSYEGGDGNDLTVTVVP